MRLLLVLPLLLFQVTRAAEITVATLHPLLSEIVREVGGERVEVIDLIAKNADPHHFEPTPENLSRAGGADLFLASGRGLESFLPAITTLIGPRSRLVEIGASLPASGEICTDHDHGAHGDAHDPHWWHSIDAFRRATLIVANLFSEFDPSGREFYQANALAYRARLDGLDRWVRRQIATIPRDRRILASTHAAFGYFCHDYGFEAIPIQGVNREQMPDPAALAALIARLKDEQVPVIFPEQESNPKILDAITRDTGIRLGEPLIADGSTAESYEAMIRHNVSALVAALR